MLSIQCLCVAVGLSLLGIGGCAAAIDTGPAHDDAQKGTVSCGTLTCNADQTCLVSQSLRPYSNEPRSYSCIETPAGCGGLELCDCPATQGEIQGKPVTGCSLLGERSLYVTDVTCGERRCDSGEYCLVKHEGAGAATAVLSRECRRSPDVCASDSCSTDCKAEIAAAESVAVLGCLKSEFAVAIDAQ